MTLRCHLTGGGIKPPNGALVKSHGTERLGKDNPTRLSGMDIRVERK
jgi:hypothetical protein